MEVETKKIQQELEKNKEFQDENSQVKEHLQAENQLSERIFNSIGVGVLIFDSSGKLKKYNHYAFNIFLLKLSETTSAIELFPDIPGIHENFKDSFTIPGQMLEFETKFSSTKNRSLTLGVTVTKINDDENAETELIFSIRDLTEAKLRERKMRELQEQITENAYRDGVAENAVSILHNIGNILTSIIAKVSTTDTIEQFEISNNILEKIFTELNKHHQQKTLSSYLNEDPKGKNIFPLLAELIKNYRELYPEIDKTNRFIQEKCMHIGNIIQTQQQYANFKQKIRSNFSLKEIVQDCILMHNDRLTKRAINLEIDIPTNHIVFIEKVGLAQTISNAIMNAVEAIDERTEKDPLYLEKQIQVTASVLEKFSVLTIKDNGIGISSEVISKLFKFGFSTKNRSSGFGLHNCSNFMRSNGGEIKITSDGVNLGASTILTIPLPEIEEPEKLPNIF